MSATSAALEDQQAAKSFAALDFDRATTHRLFSAGLAFSNDTLDLYTNTLSTSVSVGAWLDTFVLMLEDLSAEESLFVINTGVSSVTITMTKSQELPHVQLLLCGLMIKHIRLSGLLPEGLIECHLHGSIEEWQGHRFAEDTDLLVRLSVRRESLTQPMRNANPRLNEAFLSQLNIYRRGLGNHKNIEFAVVREVARTENWDALSQSAVASQLAMSERTLSRKLNSEGLKFRDIVAAARNTKALSLLFAGESIESISLQLGFSDRATFERSFKKWQGISPAKIQAQYVSLSHGSNVKDIIDAEQLPHLPSTVTKLLDCLRDPEATIEQIIELLQGDPVLVAKIMKVANSSMYAHVKVANLKQAVIAIFGVEKLYALTLAIMSSQTFARELKGFNYAHFWHRALLATHIVEELNEASNANKVEAETAYLAALLHNIGELVLHFYLPDEMRDCAAELDELSTWREQNRFQQHRLGTSTVAVSAFVSRLWHMPKEMCRVVESLGPVGDSKHGVVHHSLDILDYLMLPTQQTQRQIKPLLQHYFASNDQQKAFLVRCREVRDELLSLANALSPSSAA
ncbi:HDOD domain-containing protein [Alteromonas flava]|uniref:HDOD domain-containing protein n=1 Tax=Alteromonas flava TaxID=2048003 RepID=UPI0013DCA238|nr:HDOD domain-containing protein [Alteromonas flava]